jgi:cellulose synthase/poly-beta-1,6-N-acetylglucosamine synthase-like glycosyltransferase
MKVTIAVPHYKNLEALRRLVVALQEQKIPVNSASQVDLEIIIINDELENTIKARDFGEHNFDLNIINKEHEGVAAARNTAIKEARGEIILFLDQDCVPQNDWLYNMICSFLKNKGVCGVGGKIIPLPNRGLVNEYFNFVNHLEKPIVDRKNGEIVTIITGNSGFRREALNAIGGFDQNIFDLSSHGGEDVDITYRLKLSNYHVIYEPSAVVFHEYPNKFSDIFFKYANYGRGMRLFCIARKVDPETIRQPRLTIFSLLCYCCQIIIKTIESFLKFIRSRKIITALIFTIFELVRNFGYVYGYYYGKYKIITVSARQ